MISILLLSAFLASPGDLMSLAEKMKHIRSTAYNEFAPFRRFPSQAQMSSVSRSLLQLSKEIPK